MKKKNNDQLKKGPKDPRKKLLIGLIAATITIISGIVALVLLSSGMIGETSPGIVRSIVSFVKTPFQKNETTTSKKLEDEKQERINVALKKYKPVYKRNPDHPLGIRDESLVKNIIMRGMPKAEGWKEFIDDIDKAALLMVNENGNIENIRLNMDHTAGMTEGRLRGYDLEYKQLNDRYTAIRDRYLETQKSFTDVAKAMSGMYDLAIPATKDVLDKRLADAETKIKPEWRAEWEKKEIEAAKKMEPAYKEAESKIASGRMTQESIYKKLTTNEDIAHRFQGFVYGMTDLRAQMIVNRAKSDAASSLVIR